LVGARVWTKIVKQVDEARSSLSRNDWLTAAILVALDNPDALQEAVKRIDDLDPSRAFKKLSLAKRP